MNLQIFLQLGLSGLSVGSIYALIGLALVIPYKASRVVNFAQGEMVTLGAYIALILSLNVGMTYALIVPLTLVFAGAFGVTVERLFVRPLTKAPEFTLVIMTFAIGLIIKAIVRLIYQDNVYPFDAPYKGPYLSIGPLRANPSYLVIIAATAVLVAVLTVFLKYTRYGKAMRAAASNQEAARLMGIPVAGISMAAWAIASATGAFAGLLLAPTIGVNPEMGNLILKGLISAVIGGFSSMGGAVIGGVALGLLETYTGALFGASFRTILPFTVLIGLLMIRPQGLFAQASGERV